MSDRMERRGPDGEGLFIDGKVGLAHRRLAIIDLETGNQPMSLANGEVVIVFNGEIYNYKSLREELVQQGFTFHTSSDTEVVAAAYSFYGLEKSLLKLEGMFAFAIYDKLKQKVFLVRDRFGVKPLYFQQDGEHFSFASELKAFAPSLNTHHLDKTALNIFLSVGYIPAPYSIYEEIRKVMPGKWMEISCDGEVSEHRYYDVKEEMSGPALTDEKEASELLRNRLAEAVRRRMVSDVAVGAFLSGGIDSSIVCCLMAKMQKEPIKTFSIGFNERDYDESERAEIVAKHIGANHTRFVLSYEEALPMLDELIAYYDEPFGDSSAIPSYYVARLASEHVKVVLTGDCADELFAGYEKYLAKYYVDKYNHLPQWIRKSMEWGVGHCPINKYTNNLLRKAKKVIRNSRFDGLDLYYALLCLGFDDDGRKSVLCNDFYRDVKGFYREQYHSFDDDVTYLQRQQLLDVGRVLEGQMFPKVDRACMHVSLENRAPFLDGSIVNLAFHLSDSLKQHGKDKKYILKKAFADILPEATTHFSKKGFGVPVDHWMRHELKDDLCRLLAPERLKRQGIFLPEIVSQLLEEHISGKENHKERLWFLYVFQKWWDNASLH